MDLVLFLVSIGLCAVALVRVLGNSGLKQQETIQESATDFMAPCIAVLVFLFLQSLFARHAWFQIGGDEYFRALYALEWARNPYFATQDHIWLAGHFYTLGSLFLLTGSLKFSVALAGLVGTAFLVFFTALTVQRLNQPPLVAGIVAILLGGNWMILWASVGTMAEVFFYPLLAAALGNWVLFWQSNSETNKTRQLFGTACCIGVATMFRYEAWMIGIPLGIFTLVAATNSLIKNGFGRHSFLQFFTPFVLAIYPCLHVISCWINLGSPLAFLTGTEALNVSTNQFFDHNNLLAKFFAYPVTLWQDHWYLLPLPLTGLALAFHQANRKRWSPLLVAFGVVLLCSMIFSAKSGLGSNNRPRFSMFLLIMLQPFAALPLRAILAPLNGGGLKQVFIRSFVLMTLLLSLYCGFTKAKKYYPNGWTLDSGDMQLLLLLEHGAEAKREIQGTRPVQLPGFGMFIYTGEDSLAFASIVYHAPNPGNVYRLYHFNDLQELANKPGFAVYVVKTTPEMNLEFLNVHYQKTHETDGWEVWQPK